MFEPENDIERMLVRASAESADHPIITLRTGIPVTAGSKSGFLH